MNSSDIVFCENRTISHTSHSTVAPTAVSLDIPSISSVRPGAALRAGESDRDRALQDCYFRTVLFTHDRVAVIKESVDLLIDLLVVHHNFGWVVCECLIVSHDERLARRPFNGWMVSADTSIRPSTNPVLQRVVY